MTSTLLDARSISKSYEGVQALRGVSFDVRAGEVHALVGENGAGKSTLIKVITGAVTPDAGTLSVAGRAVPAMTPAISRALGIAAIYQQPSLFPQLTVAENIALALETGHAWRRVDWRARSRTASELLARVGASIAPDRLVETLSMPEQQMVEIAKALGAEARLLIMDEPTASLTEREAGHLFEVIDGLRAAGAGVIYISHRLEEIFTVADRITVLRDGQTVGTSPRADVARAGSDPADGRARALVRLSQADRRDWRRRARTARRDAPRVRHPRRVAGSEARRDPRPGRPRRIGPHRAGRSDVRAASG